MSSVPSNANQLEPHLQKLMRGFVTLKDSEVKRANSHLKGVLDNIITHIKVKNTDETFKVLYKQPHYVGSFYENLRVGQPDEFDINLELQLPLNEADIQIETTGTVAGFAKIKVGSKFHSHISETVRRKIESWCEKGYLCRDEVIQWLQGIVSKALQNATWASNMTVRQIMSGPAVTLKVKENNKEFSVDLVPVFTFGANKWPAPPMRQLNNLPRKIETSVKWCIVPKSPRQDSASRQQWRMSFYLHEKQLMNDLNNMKPVIKLMKLLRDKENWTNLSSYYIKTLFMWEQEIQSNVSDFWKNGLGYLFMHMLGKLEGYLKSEKIPFFWDKRSNLIGHMRKEEKQNMCCRVTHLKRKLEQALLLPDQNLASMVNGLFIGSARQKGTRCQSQNSQQVPAGQEETRRQSQDLQQAGSVGWAPVVAVSAVAVGAALLLWRRNRND